MPRKGWTREMISFHKLANYSTFFWVSFSDIFLRSFQGSWQLRKKTSNVYICEPASGISTEFLKSSAQDRKNSVWKTLLEIVYQRGVSAETFGNLVTCLLCFENFSPFDYLPVAPVVFFHA